MEARESLKVLEGGRGESAGAEPNGLDLSDKSGPIVGSRLWASRIRKRAKELVSTLDTGYMELARILYQVYDTPVEGDPRRSGVYTTWGYQSYADYAERELGLHRKKAERLRRIWFVLEIQCKDLDPQVKQRVVNLGFAKVRELVKVLSPRNAENLVSQAETMNYKQLEVVVADEGRRQGLAEAVLGGGDDGPGPLPEESENTLPHPDDTQATIELPTSENFQLFPKQLLNVRLALQRAAELSNSNKKGHQLDLICTDFLATNDVMAGDSDKRLRYVAKIERTVGLKLIAVDPDTNEIVYGLSALKEVVDSAGDQ